MCTRISNNLLPDSRANGVVPGACGQSSNVQQHRLGAPKLKLALPTTKSEDANVTTGRELDSGQGSPSTFSRFVHDLHRSVSVLQLAVAVFVQQKSFMLPKAQPHSKTLLCAQLTSYHPFADLGDLNQVSD